MKVDGHISNWMIWGGRKSDKSWKWTVLILPTISDIVQSSILSILKLSIFLERPFWTVTKIQFVRIDFHFE